MTDAPAKTIIAFGLMGVAIIALLMGTGSLMRWERGHSPASRKMVTAIQ